MNDRTVKEIVRDLLEIVPTSSLTLAGLLISELLESTINETSTVIERQIVGLKTAARSDS